MGRMSDEREVRKKEKRRQPLTLGDAVLVPRNWSERIAHWISLIGSPPVMGVLSVMLITCATRYSIPVDVGHLLRHHGHRPAAPLSPLVGANGDVTDLDIQLRQQRSRPFLAMMTGQAVAWLLLTAGSAPSPLPMIAGAYLVQTSLILLITLRWKISVHTSTAAGVTVAVWGTLGTVAVPFALTLPLIVWSRVKLRRHTLGQTLAGTALGSGIFLAALLLGH